MPDESTDDSLVREIRDNFEADDDAFKPIRDDGDLDMRAVAGDPWDPAERKEREDAGRPCLVLDELGQYVNQTINNIRQNKRSIKIDPAGQGATETTATTKQDMARQIEYESNGQYAYITGFENVLQRSYGSFRISAEYENERSFNQKIVIHEIPNPNAVLWDYTSKKRDNSDADHCFLLDRIKRKEFKRRWKNAKVQDFTSAHLTEAKQWINDDDVQIAEYWKVHKKPRKLLLLSIPGIDPQTKRPGAPDVRPIFEDELLDEMKPYLIPGKERTVQFPEVKQHITNGIEVLEENKWAGRWIPIVSMYGKELYVDYGSGARRVLMSMVRLARDPYMLYCYYRTCEAELVGMTPKTPFIGYKGQFTGFEDVWENINKSPMAYAEVNPVVDSVSGQVLPVPERPKFEPAIQALEAGAEAARRAIQAAMGISPLPTSAQRKNEKSGVALKQIEQQEDRGSFHFIDAFDTGIKRGGVIVDDLMPKIYDTDRMVGVRRKDDTHEVIRINSPHKDDKGKDQHFPVDNSEHLVTISVGPSFDSQREEASDFVDTLVGNLQAIAAILPPGSAARLLALSIKLKQSHLGTIGEEMVKLLSPDNEDIPPQAQAAIQQAQQQVQAVMAELKKLQDEKAAKVVDNEYKLQIEQMNVEGRVAVAEITTKSQDSMKRAEMEMDILKFAHGNAHEAGMQAVDHAHEKDLAVKQQEAAAEQSANQNAPQEAVPA